MQMIETKFVEYCKTLALSNKARSQNLVIVVRKATQTHKIGGGGDKYKTGKLFYRKPGTVFPLNV